MMMPLKARSVEEPHGPGEFAWRVCDEYMEAAEGGQIPARLRPPLAGEHPTHMLYRSPTDVVGLIAIRGHGHQQNGHSWEWDGDRDTPTLKPSIQQPDNGWHGWLRAGKWETA